MLEQSLNAPTSLLTRPIVNMITFLKPRGFFAFFETISLVFIESKVKSWLTVSSSSTVHSRDFKTLLDPSRPFQSLIDPPKPS